MAAKTYGRPRLTTSNDKRYRAHVEQFVLQRKNRKPMHPPRQRDIFGGQAESALRDWLAQHMSLDERRILEYEERRGKRATMKYRELDGVVIEDKQNIWIFESKASRTAHSLHRAVAQLKETREILRLLYHNVHTTILLVNTGIPTAEEVAELMADPEAPEVPPQTLPEALDALQDTRLLNDLTERSHDGVTLDVLLFSVDDIIALAGEENLALDWSDEQEEIDEQAPRPVTTTVYSSEEEEGEPTEEEGSLAEALRRAGLG
jgi:hypothetical protein